MRDSEIRAKIYRRGRWCLTKIRKDGNWLWWMGVKEAICAARDEACEVSNSKVPVKGDKSRSSRYNKAFSTILVREKLDSNHLRRTTRNQLFVIAEKLPAIEAWRNNLRLEERERYNSPAAVLEHWKKTFEVDRPRDP